jgi:endonuclease/exonuclease/phosphatase family metal-dependent hydrolase
MIIAGDFSVRVGNKPMKVVMRTNGKATLNQHGKLSIDLAAFHGITITSTFFKHCNIHKCTRSQRGTQTIMDYILTNRKLSPLTQDTRVHRGGDVASDHFLPISNLILLRRWKQNHDEQCYPKKPIRHTY